MKLSNYKILAISLFRNFNIGGEKYRATNFYIYTFVENLESIGDKPSQWNSDLNHLLNEEGMYLNKEALIHFEYNESEKNMVL
ncbi:MULTISPECIES: hypothetical protein [Streptococcus]|uniref:hypothetical protein n=1 Tax=Streptococcus TaxID=1301 RepID=UPI00110C231C|nr:MULTISPECIES: hypothetical protein [Streptococcus]MBF9657779.1 hypothetical protein [Streptococcus pseudopneumoniae]TMR48986.1 hypothetical protein E3V85_00210 [Streptococcus pseudopneumoniae]